MFHRDNRNRRLKILYREPTRAVEKNHQQRRGRGEEEQQRVSLSLLLFSLPHILWGGGKSIVGQSLSGPPPFFFFLRLLRPFGLRQRQVKSSLKVVKLHALRSQFRLRFTAYERFTCKNRLVLRKDFGSGVWVHLLPFGISVSFLGFWGVPSLRYLYCILMGFSSMYPRPRISELFFPACL